MPLTRKCFVYLLWMYMSLKFKHFAVPDLVDYLRSKLILHYRKLQTQLQKKATADLVIKFLPFLFGAGIQKLMDSFIRFGQQLIRQHDQFLFKLYQFVFQELVGFKVDSIYIENYLNRNHRKKEPFTFRENADECQSPEPETFKIQMKSMIGPNKVNKTLNSLIAHNIPSNEFLSQYVNESILVKQDDQTDFQSSRSNSQKVLLLGDKRLSVSESRSDSIQTIYCDQTSPSMRSLQQISPHFEKHRFKLRFKEFDIKKFSIFKEIAPMMRPNISTDRCKQLLVETPIKQLTRSQLGFQELLNQEKPLYAIERHRFLEIDGEENLQSNQILLRSKNLTPVIQMKQQLDENRMPLPPPPTFSKVSLQSRMTNLLSKIRARAGKNK